MGIVFIRCRKEDDDADPGEPIEITFEVTDPSETGASDGSIITELTGGVAPFSFLWSNGDESQNVEELPAGMYTLTVTDSRDKVAVDSVELIDVLIDVDGNTYSFKKIGEQVWMRQNLRVTHAPDSTDIVSYVYNNDTTYAEVYGRLYTWNVAMNGSVEEGAQGICPCGWHIPSDEEFKILEMYLGMSRELADMKNWRGSPVGTRLKVGGDSGYDAKISGRFVYGSYGYMHSSEYVWTSSEYNNDAWRRCLSSGDSRVGRYATFGKGAGFSVRCVKDQQTTE
jgi:uncharacterized protein (TIGR02145 family)